MRRPDVATNGGQGTGEARTASRVLGRTLTACAVATLSGALLITLQASPVPGQSPRAATAPADAQRSATEIMDRAEGALWGNTLQARLTMTVATRRWTRTLELAAWIERPRRSFIRILAPAKEAGIGSLRIGPEMWNYLPTVERTIKIPPSMMLQPWMGSDFTNDDLVKESSLLEDYTHRIVAVDTTADVPAYVIESVPKRDAAVVWGRIVSRVRRSDLLPAREEFYDERGTLVRVLTFSDIRTLGGRTIPTRWEMRPTAKPGNVTTVVMTQAAYDAPIDAEVFTQRNLARR